MHPVCLQSPYADANAQAYITLHWLCACGAQSTGILGPCAATFVVRCSPVVRAGEGAVLPSPVPSPFDVQDLYEKANVELIRANKGRLDPRLLGEVLACDPRIATRGLGAVQHVAKQSGTSAEEADEVVRMHLREEPGVSDIEPYRIAYCPMCGDRLLFDGTRIWAGKFGSVAKHLCHLREHTLVQTLWDSDWSGRTTYLMLAPVAED